MTILNKSKMISLLFTLTLSMAACEDTATVSVAEETDNFLQETSFNNKIDILWVIDNSGSMANLQNNVASNFSAFINTFVAKSYDFQMAVTTTEAWRETKGNVYCPQANNISRYRSNSGVSILKPNTPNLQSAFIANISQGTNGCGDERAFDSVVQALENSDNIALGFPRSDSFLAVIIVSDEDDFSHAGGEYLVNDRNDPRLISVGVYKEALELLTNSNSIKKNYNVSSIAIHDSGCLAQNSNGVMGLRYEELVNSTNGIMGSVCAANFSENLDLIQQKIVTLSTQFYLSREPILGSIVVKVNSMDVAQSETNGWSYDATSNSVLFHGNAIPSQGASIEINFDPVGLIN